MRGLKARQASQVTCTQSTGSRGQDETTCTAFALPASPPSSHIKADPDIRTRRQVCKAQQDKPAPREQPEQTVCMMLLVGVAHQSTCCSAWHVCPATSSWRTISARICARTSNLAVLHMTLLFVLPCGVSEGAAGAAGPAGPQGDQGAPGELTQAKSAVELKLQPPACSAQQAQWLAASAPCQQVRSQDSFSAPL